VALSESTLLELARNQHGLFTTQQALDAGFSRTQIRDRHACGRWTRVGRGVHHVAGAPFTWRTQLMVACLATGGVASHKSAAVLHGVAGMRPGRPEVTVRRGRRVRQAVGTIHQSTDLAPVHIKAIDGIPATTPARLAVDLGAVVTFPTYERAMDDLIARRVLSWDEILDLLCLLSRRGRDGLGAARALLLERYGDDVPESVLERAFLQLVRGASLPEPVPQVEVSDAAGFIARVDFAYPDRRLAIELDSRRHHLHADAFESDRSKRNRLQLLGWQVLSYTWDQVIRSGPTVAGQVGRALAPPPN
jgi:hypothetical protein